jgi:phosphate/sulfate permease
MSRKVTAALLITAAVLTNAAFTVLGMVFNYPDVLKEPVEEILAKFRASQNAVMFWFALLALSAALFAPIAVGVGRLSTHRTMRLAVPVGIAAAVVAAGDQASLPLTAPRRAEVNHSPAARAFRSGDAR